MQILRADGTRENIGGMK
ncbi:hypothetical protein ACWU7O_003570 [Escherichia coli]